MCNCHPETCCCDQEKDEYVASLEEAMVLADRIIKLLEERVALLEKRIALLELVEGRNA